MTKRASETCRLFCYNKAKVAALKKKMPDEARLSSVGALFDLIADVTRLKILWALSGSELCVCDIAHVLNMSVSAVSHQLRLLRGARIVVRRQQGQMVFYRLSHGPFLAWIGEGMRLKRG